MQRCIPPMPKVLSTMRGIPWSCATFQKEKMVGEVSSTVITYLGQCRDVIEDKTRIPDGFDENGLCLLVDSGRECLWVS